MTVFQHRYDIQVHVVDGIRFDAHEAAWLREMAKFCIEEGMPGLDACKRLIAVLDRANIPPYHGGPVYGLFEEGEGAEGWLRLAGGR
jgi:hypothetical protein